MYFKLPFIKGTVRKRLSFSINNDYPWMNPSLKLLGVVGQIN